MSKKPAEASTTPPPSPAQANATTTEQIHTMEAEGQAQDAAPADVEGETPRTGGTSTPASDAHDAALDQEVDTFGAITPEKGPVS